MVLPVLNKDFPLVSVLKEDAVNLNLISTAGNLIVYGLQYGFNPKLANQLNATKLLISIQTQLGNNTTKPQLIKGFTVDQITENLLQQVNIYKAASQIKNQYPFSVTKNLARYFDPKTIDSATLYTKTYVNVEVEQSNTLNRRVNSANQNLNANVNLNTYVSPLPFNLRKERSNLKTKKKIDPASLYNTGTNAMVPTSKAYSGLIPSRAFTQNPILQNNSKAKQLVTAFLSKTVTNSPKDAPAKTYLTEIKKIATDTIVVSDRIFIPIGIAGQSDFKLVFELFDVYDHRVQKFEVFVPHNTNINNTYITKSPFVTKKANTGVGKPTFIIEQVDPYAYGVSVYRRTLFAQDNMPFANYVKITDISLKSGDTAKTFVDNVLTSSDIIYRFVPYDKDKKSASVFATVLVSNSSINKNGSNMPLPKKLSTRQNYCSLDYAIDNDCIIMKASNFPADVVAVYYYRRNTTINETLFKRIGGISRVQPSSSLPFRLVDTSVKKYNCYEYKIGFIYSDGLEQMSRNVMAVEFRPIEKNVAACNITNIKTGTYIDGFSDVTFNVSYSFNKNQYEDIKNLITKQGLLSEYNEQIVENKQFLGRLYAYKVLRLNMSTGELEDFGVITDNNFSDRQQGLAKGVTPISEGIEYSYKVITFLRNPETLFPTVQKTVSKIKKQSIKSINKSYVLYPYEWQQPVTFRNGTLYSDDSVIRSYPRKLPSFEFGDVVDIKEVTVKVVSDLPNITNLQAISLGPQRCILKWGVNGSRRKIDHFVIVRDILGTKTIVGAAHCLPNANDSQMLYLDTFNNNEKGQVTYTLIPIYYDDTEGPPTRSNTILM